MLASVSVPCAALIKIDSGSSPSPGRRNRDALPQQRGTFRGGGLQGRQRHRGRVRDRVHRRAITLVVLAGLPLPASVAVDVT